jgi:hypothetical protein
MKRSLSFALALVLLVCLLLTAVSMPVLAQGSTVLAVDPAQSNVEVSGQREISLYVTDADNLNAFDVQVEYNPALLTLVNWEFGDLLSNLAVVKRDDLPGSFRLVATQLATPGVSGDGVLFKLTFSGKLTGSSAIMITKAEFARSEGGLSLPEIVNGSITIIPAQPTATATLTPIPTATATLAPTATATKQPTATQAATSVPSATATATRAATSTPAPTRTAGSQQTATTGAVGGVGATDEPTPAVTQPEPGKATAEGGGIAAGPTGQSGVSGSSGGNGYFLQRSSRYSPNTAVMILFVGGLLAIGAAVVIYANRKKRI